MKYCDKCGQTLPTTGGVPFEDFWQLYPNRKGKADASRAWAKLKPSDALWLKMASALQLQIRSPQWRKDGGAFIPYPGTWIRGRRWEDELRPSERTRTLTLLEDAEDWYDECKRLHGGECGARHLHNHRISLDEYRASKSTVDALLEK